MKGTAARALGLVDLPLTSQASTTIYVRRLKLLLMVTLPVGAICLFVAVVVAKVVPASVAAAALIGILVGIFLSLRLSDIMLRREWDRLGLARKDVNDARRDLERRLNEWRLLQGLTDPEPRRPGPGDQGHPPGDPSYRRRRF